MKYVIRNAETLDYFRGFDRKDGRPIFSPYEREAQWFDTKRERDEAMALISKAGYPCVSEVLRR